MCLTEKGVPHGHLLALLQVRVSEPIKPVQSRIGLRSCRLVARRELLESRKLLLVGLRCVRGSRMRQARGAQLAKSV